MSFIICFKNWIKLNKQIILSEKSFCVKIKECKYKWNNHQFQVNLSVQYLAIIMILITKYLQMLIGSQSLTF